MSWVPVAAVGALWGVPYLMKIYGWNNTTAGEWCSLFWIGLALGSPLMGWWTMRQKRRLPSLYWCFLIGIVSAFMVVYASSLSPVLLGIALFGLGWSCSVQSLSFGLLKDTLPAAVFGTASGFNNMAAILGGGLAQTSIGYTLHWLWNGAKIDNIPTYSIGDYQIAFAILPAAAIIGFIVSVFLIRESYCKDFEA
jgi:MFS-type transporter involved in bile tolerance (Atg22 family)